jgi:glycoside/pentoside/hexuronide:cation symporter, GPH family
MSTSTPAFISASNQKLSVVEKIGYSLGDLAANLIFQTLVTFLAFFYTDVFGIPASEATFIIGTVGLVGAFIFTPLMGILADRTKTRWGKFRPWLLWTAIPFGVIAILAFTTPDLTQDQKIVYAYVTYTLLLLIYAANNLPYSALSGVLTSNIEERNSVSAYRFVAVMVAQLIIQVLLLPGDKAAGFHSTMILFAGMGTLFFLIAFFTTKERVLPIAESSNSVLEDLGDCAKNLPWIIMLIVTVLAFVSLALRGGITIYYFQNYLNASDLAAFLENIGFNSFIGGVNAFFMSMGFSEFQWPKDPVISANSMFAGCNIIMQIIGICFSKTLADRFGKRNVYALFLTIATSFIFAFNFLSPSSIGIIFIVQILQGFFYGICVPILWAMISDVADYSEWKNNRRATAIIFSAMLIGLKAGLTIGGSLVAGLLAMYGYSANLTVQNAETINGIKTIMSVYASLPFFISVACLFFYSINKKMELKLEAELNARRQAAGK